ncbi:hypothetical protein M1146_07445, partial [Patescibacteria group bacterium]|nr:hypothetical protein [Patescibacteria group bacterium]
NTHDFKWRYSQKRCKNFSTIAAVILLSEKITFTFILGSVLILIGIFIAEGHIRHFKIKSKSVHSGVFVEE